METAIIPTKLHPPPIGPRLVERPRLWQQLDAGVAEGHSLFLIAAPAGYGKTTLLQSWLARLPALWRTAWLSLDAQDNRPGRFWVYLDAALATAVPAYTPVSAASANVVEPEQPTHRLQALLHQLTDCTEPLQIILDDFHEITHPALLEDVARLVDYLPPGVRLILTSRAAPDLPLPRWQVRRRLTWLTEADLRFLPAETAQFFSQTMQLSLPEGEIRTLLERTEGWVAGLQLAAISRRSGTDGAALPHISGDDRYVADYLLSEVLAQQETDLQRFLMQMALFDRFCVDLADWLQPDRDSRRLLAESEQRQLFVVPLDNARRWYRLHHLFQELLQSRVRQEMGETAVRELYGRSVSWFAQNGQPNEAIQYALQAQDEPMAAALLEKMPLALLWRQGQADLVKTWAAALPDALYVEYPQILVKAVLAHMLGGDFQELIAYLNQLERIPQLTPVWKLLRAVIQRNEGDIPGAIALIQEARPDLEDTDPHLMLLANLQLVSNYYQSGQLDKAELAAQTVQKLSRGKTISDPVVQLHAVEIEGFINLNRGDLSRAQALFQRGLALLPNAHEQPIVGLMHNGLGSVAYVQNDLQTAAEQFARGMELAQRSGIVDVLTGALFGQLDLARQRRDWATTELLLARMQQEFADSFVELVGDMVASTAADYHLRWGELEQALRWARGIEVDLAGVPPMSRLYEAILWVNTQLAAAQNGRAAQPLPVLDAYLRQLAAAVTTAGHQLYLLRIRLSQAVLADLSGETAEMTVHLLSALELGRRGSVVRHYLDVMPPVVPLFAQLTPTLSPDHPDRSKITRLQLLWEAENGRAAPPVSAGLVEPLTEREFEMLQCIAAGYSNRQIQEKFIISRNTVRTHLKNLYGKLGVDGRETAVARARELHLI
jgi:LuxR family maltose regulon positive regulatory protein